MSLSNRDFRRLTQFIYSELGIKMPESKQTMLVGRLAKRVRALGLGSHADYCEFLFSEQGQKNELVHLFDAVTTNKTDFFREPAHFDYLTQKALPELMASHGTGVERKLQIWSAGCSSGEEPYTMSMVLSAFGEANPQWRYGFEVLATDISSRVLDMARRAVYAEERIQPVPERFKKKYILRSKNRKSALVRMVPEVRNTVRFGRLNFMDDDYGLPCAQHVIFCRNVIIYFDRPTQERMITKLCRYLVPGGYLFLGHSESLHGHHVPVQQVAPTVYRKPL